jgi:hypothetical protein
VTDETAPGSDGAPADRLRRGVLALAWTAIAILALGLRVWGIAFGTGLPRARPDEEMYLGPAIRMFDGNLDPNLWYGFTDGFCLLLHAALRLQTTLLAWRHGGEVHLGCLFALQPTAVLSTGRYVSVLLGVATLIPCALVARRLVTPVRADAAGTIAALLLAVDYLHGRDSHFAVPDTALAFALAWALAGAVAFAEDGRPRDGLLAGVATGLAVALKWTGLFMAPVLAIAMAIGLLRVRDDGRRPRVTVTAAAFLLAVGTFVALEPHLRGNPGETIRGLLSHATRYGEAGLIYTQDPSTDLGRGIVFHTRSTLPIACGWFGLAMAVVGLGLGFRRRPIAAAVGVIFLVFLYVLAVGPTRTLFVRYCMPVLPLLAALAAAGLAEGVHSLRRWIPGWRARGAVLALGVAAAALPPAVRLAQADVRLARADTRTLAVEWLHAHAAPDATVVPLVGYASIYAVPVEGIVACGAVLPAALRATVTTLTPIGMPGWERWTPAVARGRAGWGAVAERALLDYWNMPGVTPAHGDYVAYGQPLLSCGKPSFVRGLTPPDPVCFEAVAHFGPGQPSCDAVYDLFDQFYLPYAGFAGIERPGPDVTIYRNRCRRADQ